MAKPERKKDYTAERQVRHASLRVKHKGKPITNEDLVEAIWSLREEIAGIIARAASTLGNTSETSQVLASPGEPDHADVLAAIGGLQTEIREMIRTALAEAAPQPAADTDALRQEIATLRAELASVAGNGGAPAAPAFDPAAIMEEIAAVRGDIETIIGNAMVSAAPAAANAPPAPFAEDNFNAHDVRLEIAQMVRTIARAKNEIAAIKQPTQEDEDDRLDRASNELDAIVTATESATRDILIANEEIGSLVDQIANAAADNPEITGHTERIAEILITIFEACSFQDITGQRITKVVRTLQFIQDRILAMINIWGVEAFADLPVSLPGQEDDDEAKLLNGPQLENEGITQAEIDALFD